MIGLWERVRDSMPWLVFDRREGDACEHITHSSLEFRRQCGAYHHGMMERYVRQKRRQAKLRVRFNLAYGLDDLSKFIQCRGGDEMIGERDVYLRVTAGWTPACSARNQRSELGIAAVEAEGEGHACSNC